MWSRFTGFYRVFTCCNLVLLGFTGFDEMPQAFYGVLLDLHRISFYRSWWKGIRWCTRTVCRSRTARSSTWRTDEVRTKKKKKGTAPFFFCNFLFCVFFFSVKVPVKKIRKENEKSREIARHLFLFYFSFLFSFFFLKGGRKRNSFWNKKATSTITISRNDRVELEQ